MCYALRVYHRHSVQQNVNFLSIAFFHVTLTQGQWYQPLQHLHWIHWQDLG